MTLIVLVKLLLVGLLTGTLIGTVGIGGILLAPFLSYLLAIDLHLAMAVSSWSFLFTGIGGTVTYAIKGSIPWRMACWLSGGIIPAAVLGARTNSSLTTTALTIILALLITFSGVNALRKQFRSTNTAHELSPLILLLIGFGVGFGSALTGTGGPVLLVPILIFLHIEPLAAIGVSQVVQLPIAVSASIGFGLYGQIDFRLGTIVGIIQTAAVLGGAWLAHHMSADWLRKVVAFALVCAGIFLAARSMV